MTNPTPHGQVPEALIDLIDAYAETRHRCGGIYNAKTEAARKAVIEALSGVQALSAAPAGLVDAARMAVEVLDWLPTSDQTNALWQRQQPVLEALRAALAASPPPPAECITVDEFRPCPCCFGAGVEGTADDYGHTIDVACGECNGSGRDSKPTPPAEQAAITPETGNSVSAKGAAITSESGTPPTEQQATKETSGGFHVWRDIATAPKDGSRFVATGHNYGLYSEVRHTCVAQWFRGCWMEASDWNETSELKYLTHWMPLPSPPDDVAAPAEQQADPKAAPGVGNSGFDHQTAADLLSGKTVSDEAVREFVAASRWAHDEKAALGAMLLSVRGVLASREAEIALLKKALLEAEAAPQQEAQEPCPTCVALARTVMLGQVSFDRKPDCYGIRQITDDEGVEEWEDIRTSPDVAREEANDMMATGRGEIYEVVPLWTTPQPAPAPLSDDADRLREALQRIEGASMSMYATRSDMLEHCQDIARAALATQKGNP